MRTAHRKVGENYGSVFELLNAKSLHELVQKGDIPLTDILTQYTELLKQVHGTRFEIGELPSYRVRFLDYINVIKGCLSDGQEQQLKKLLVDMPEDNTVVHGDIHMKNVMMVDNEPMLIDMDTLGLGNPVFDLAGVYVTYQMFEEDDPDNSMDFLGMTNEMVDEIWNSIMDSYFDFRDCEEKKKITDRIVHAVSHIEELLKTVTQISI